MAATRSTSSGQRCQESQASPLDSVQPLPGACSKSHQSVLKLAPSVWCADVAVPHKKPDGNVILGTARTLSPDDRRNPCSNHVASGCWARPATPDDLSSTSSLRAVCRTG